MRTTVQLRGVGGQSLPLIVSMLGRRAADAGVSLTSREVFGMAQRGGAVFATLDIDEPGPGCADDARSVLIAFELLEGVRGFEVLRPGEAAFVSTARLVPPDSWGGAATRYPTAEEVMRLAADLQVALTLVDAAASAPWRVVQAAIEAGAIPLGARTRTVAR
ncbi:MAG: 2-oxoacid:acceptor oxidoreductase family protein [Chloroflexi bacterium]|nr:2-oxoacid:acceptor oxidoreductase family protein [Chloroflexota bacterium]